MESLLASLGVVFVAELGDKTQLVALGFGARHRLLPVLAGMAAAYVAANAVSVTVGAALGATFPSRAVGLVGGVLFLGFAAWILRSDGDHDLEEDELDARASGERGRGRARVFLAVAGAILVAELGDKTMLATATLAAQADPVLVFVGATVGIVLSGAVAVVLGRVIGARIPERVTRYGSAALFAAFGVALIVTNL